MSKSIISQQSMTFLADLAKNNNREWFAEHKSEYEAMRAEAKEFVTALEEEMNKEDSIEKVKLYRIYRDVRFSKDKTPYNPHIGISLSREKPALRGGYYLSLRPGNSMMACGFWGPASADLKLIREQIAQDPDAMRAAISAPSVVRSWGAMTGDQVKTAPKGYAKDHPAIDLLRYKQMVFRRDLSDKAVRGKDIVQQIAESYRDIRPFFDYMSDILTHDTNGVPLYE